MFCRGNFISGSPSPVMYVPSTTESMVSSLSLAGVSVMTGTIAVSVFSPVEDGGRTGVSCRLLFEKKSFDRVTWVGLSHCHPDVGQTVKKLSLSPLSPVTSPLYTPHLLCFLLKSCHLRQIFKQYTDIKVNLPLDFTP